MSCDDQILSLMKPYFSSNTNLSNHRFFHQLCGIVNSSSPANASTSLHNSDNHLLISDSIHLTKKNFGRDFYAFASPWIIIIGLLGNLISLRVFTSQQLRKLSASYYLIALSTSDTIVLSTYVLIDWLYKGLPRWPGRYKIPIINTEGVCQMYLFVSYTFRFVSVYLTVVFTIERFIAVCKPLKRRQICTKRFARRLILGVHIIGALISIYKPLLSGVFSIKDNILINVDYEDYINETEPINELFPDTYEKDEYICTRNIEYDNVILIMDFTYGMIITAFPFLVIFIFNLLIMHKLISTNSITKHMNFQKNRMRIEMTVMLLSISSAFILLTLPYFIIWVHRYIKTMNIEDPHIALKFHSSMYITKTIFCVNYAINFFLYCTTGKYYRGVLRTIVCGAKNTPERNMSRTGTLSAPHRNQATELSTLKSFE